MLEPATVRWTTRDHTLLQWTISYSSISNDTNCHMTRWAVHMLHLKPFMYSGVSPSSGWPLIVRSNSGRVRHPNLCKECNFLYNENTSTHKWFKVKSHDKTITCYKLTCTYTHTRNVIMLISSYCAECEIPLHTMCSITSVRCGS